MTRPITRLGLAAGLLALLCGAPAATTREVAEASGARLSFGQSVLNQLTFDTYREPFDELSDRPYNLLFANIGRHSNLTPWPEQEGARTRYLNALIGNNGTANVDNDADSIQGSLIRRETDAWAWGGAAAVLSGNHGSSDNVGGASFADEDNLQGIELRGGTAHQLSAARVLGAGFRLVKASQETIESDFEPGVGGFDGRESFDQMTLALDGGLRTFRTESSSWEARAVLSFGAMTQDEVTRDLDDTGAVTDRFVVRNYDIDDLSLGLHGAYNRLRREGVGETEYRVALERGQRELANDDLSFSEDAGGTTPEVTLVDQDAITATRLRLSARTIFQAGQTELFTGAQLAFSQTTGATTIDVGGTLVSEEIDDSATELGVTVGLRQPLYRDALRLVVSGRADLANGERTTTFDTASDGDDLSLSTTQYAIGLEGVLANVTFDVAWLTGEEAPVVPVELGLPSGSRRTVTLDRLVFSAAVSW